ncbi:tandem-95 repeat protein [Psychrosphaera aquimarina]|uniref:Tandem-95 repeat protein n=1 Tax=Psychrosphaera aquimarina TaxID=2044854 RepID=A0ABU3R1Q4_9GAMM|nr:Ig-like domain-containing protein [Psychrosphaera aquimarina]MDU0113606.1 tandem-95 repeat protein [Psychrosphaera aquimarina]
MKLAKYQISKINKTLILFMSILLTTACGKFNSEAEQSTPDTDQISDNVIDASKATLVQQKVAHKVAGVVYQTNSVATASVFNATGGFNYPSAATEFSGNISVSLDVADEQGIKQVLIGFVGSDMTLTVCEIDCGTEFSAFVNGINPKLFALSSGEQTITLWVEDNDGNLSQVNNLNINWRELVITGVSATLNPDSEELSISWSPLTTALRYNVYVSNDVALTGQNYIDLSGGEAKLALTETSTVFTQKTVTADYYILVTGIDGSGESAFSDKLILINGNKSVVPIAAADTFSTDEDQILSNNLLLNDSAEGDIIVAITTPVTLPTDGTVTITENGDFTYTPNENFNGTDQFSYSIINSHGLTSSNNVTITINAVNDLPSAINDTFVIEADTLTITSPGVLTNDTDIDNDPLTVITELLQQPKFGEVTINADGSFEYKKGVNFTSYDNFTYSISDGSDSSQSATVTITSPEFNGYPPVTINDSYETNEDAQLIVSEDKGILINDFDEDNATDELTLSVTTEPNNGALVIADDGSFTYQPNPNYFGNDQFSYSLTDDNNNSATAIVTINVIAQNDAPTPLNDSYIVQANSPNDLPPFFGILANDKDVDNDEISVVLDSVSEPTSGSLVVLEDGSFSYTPNSEFIGTDSFTYKITDGKLNSVDATVQLFVSEVIATTDDLSPITISISELTNGFDTLYEINDINAEHGEITIDGDTITYTPAKGFGGFDTITIVYLIDDEEYTVSFYLQVNLTNVAPTITSLAPITAKHNTLYSYPPTASDPNNTQSELTWTLTNAPVGMSISEVGKITWIPTTDISTSGLITLSVSDLDSTTDQQFEITVSAQDTDNDGQPNEVDTDDDNDGILDNIDSHPLVAEFTDGDTHLGFSNKGMISNGMLDNVQSLAIHPNGRYAYIGSNNGLMIADLNDDGSVTGTYNQLTTTQLGNRNSTQGNYIKFADDGNLYWASIIELNGEATFGIRVFNVDPITGEAKLSQTMPLMLKADAAAESNQPEIFEFSPNGQFLYTTVHYSSAGNYLLIYKIDQTNGHLSYAGEFDLNPFGYPDYEHNFAISSDSKFIYYAHDDSKIAILKTDTDTGLVVSTTVQSLADSIPYSIAIKASSSNQMYVAHLGVLKVMSINGSDGRLSEDHSINYGTDITNAYVMSINDDESKLIVIDEDESRKYQLSQFSLGNNIELIGQTTIDSITLDVRFNPQNNYIYWSNWSKESILYSTSLPLITNELNQNEFGNQGARISSNSLSSQFSLLGLNDSSNYKRIRDNGHGYLEHTELWPEDTEQLTSYFRGSILVDEHTAMLFGDKMYNTEGGYTGTPYAGTEVLVNKLLDDDTVESTRYTLGTGSTTYRVIYVKSLDNNKILSFEISDNHSNDSSLGGSPYGLTIYNIEDDYSLTVYAAIPAYGFLDIRNMDARLDDDTLALGTSVYQITNGIGDYIRSTDSSFYNSDNFWSETIDVTLFTDSKTVKSFISPSITPEFSINAGEHESLLKIDDKRFALLSNAEAGFVSIEVYQVTNEGDFIPLAHSKLPLQTQSTEKVKFNYDLSSYTLWLTIASGYDETFKLTFGPVIDSDNDGYFDNNDVFPADPSEWSDYDRDGVGDNSDDDLDNDGIHNDSDAFPYDYTESADTDSDGVGDNKDAFPNDNTEQQDSDLDGIGDNSDAFPYDATESEDSDSDGVGDNADVFPNDNSEHSDSDLDGVGDNSDAYPFDNTQSTFVELNSYVEVSDFSISSAYTQSTSSWFAQSEYYTAGGSALRSGAISKDQFSILKTTIDAGSEGASLSFDWKVSTQEYNAQLALYVDAQHWNAITGEHDWHNQTIELSPGTHEIEWHYIKYDSVDSNYDDAGFIDNVVLSENQKLANINWDDPNLGQCIMDNHSFTNANVNDVHYISCAGTFETLTDLVRFPNLNQVNFTETTVNDWTALVALDLFNFSLHGNTNFDDFSLLQNHSNLSTLTLYGVNLASWDFLYDFDLSYLNLDDSNFTDLNLVTHMSKLDTLLLTNNNISDWLVLSQLDLQYLSVSNTDFSDVSLVTQMTNLTGLNVNYVNLDPTNWALITNLETLWSLQASGSNISSLEGLTNLSSLALDHTYVYDFTPLKNLQLGYFTANNTTFDDFDNLAGSQNTLHQLNISYTNITELTPIYSFTNLSYLHANVPSFGTIENGILFDLYNNGMTIYEAPDNNANGIFDFLEDIDGDGEFNDIDSDDDGDGVLDINDAYPNEVDVHELIDLADAVEYSESIVTSGFTDGFARWFEQNDNFTTGNSALQSGSVRNNNRSILTTDIVAGDDGATLSFDWKINSDNSNGSLQLYVDGSQVAQINGNKLWQQMSYLLSAGSHVIEWHFQNWQGENNSGFIDNISVDQLIINDSPQITSSAPTNATEDILYTYSPTVVDLDDVNNGSDLIWTLTDEPAGMVISSTGEVTWTPLEGVYTSGLVTLTVSDGGEDNSIPYSETFTVTVTSVNDAPEFTSSNNITLDENSKSGSLVYSPVIIDPDTGQSHTFSLFDSSGAFTIDTQNGLVFVANESLLNFETTPNFTFEIVVTDEDGLWDTHSISLTLNDINDSPSISSSAPASATEDLIYTYTPSVIDEDDANNGSDLYWSLDNAPIGMTISATGVVSWTPVEGEYTSGIVTITVEDGGEDGSGPFSEQFTITVTAVNDPPTFTSSNNIAFDENSKPGAIVFTAVIEDPDIGQSHTFSLNDPSGTFAINSASGEVFLVDNSLLNFETNSTINFDITVTDENGLTTTQSVTLTVNDIIENTQFVLDSSFADGGITNINTYGDNSSSDYLADAAIDDNGSNFMLLNSFALSSGKSFIVIAKTNSNGAYDTDFGHNGIKFIDFENLHDNNIIDQNGESLFEDQSLIAAMTGTKVIPVTTIGANDYGKIYVTGSQDNGSELLPFVIRLNSDGSLDNTFSTDGKYERTITGDDTIALDLLLHSDGYLYLASNSANTTAAGSKTLKIDKLDVNGDPVVDSNSNPISGGIDLAAQGYDEQLIGLVENSSGTLVVLGYLEGGNGVSTLVAEIDKESLTGAGKLPVINDIAFDIGPNDYLYSYHQINSSTLIVAGATDVNSELDSLLVKINIDNIDPNSPSSIFDTSFNTTGYLVTNFVSGSEEQVIDVTTDIDGNISYLVRTIRTINSTPYYDLLVSQVEVTGSNNNITTSLEDIDFATMTELSNVGDFEADRVNGRLITDNNNQLRVFNSVESTADNLQGELINRYSLLSGATINETKDYEFGISHDINFETIYLLAHSNGLLYSQKTRHDFNAADGYAFYAHDINSGQLATNLGVNANKSYLQNDGNYNECLNTLPIGLFELADNSILELSLQDYDGCTNSNLVINKLSTDGTSKTGYPIIVTLSSDAISFNSYSYNENQNKIAFIAKVGTEINTPTLFIYDIDSETISNTLALDSSNIGTDSYSDIYSTYLNDIKLLDNGTVFILGSKYDPETTSETGMLVKLDFTPDNINVPAGSGTYAVDTNFDNDQTDADDLVEFAITDFEVLVPSNLEVLSDGSLVVATMAYDYNYQLYPLPASSYLLKFIDKGGYFELDTAFTDATDESTTTNNLDGAINIGFSSDTETTIRDMIVDKSDNIYLVGSTTPYDPISQYEYNNFGFIAKLNGITGEMAAEFNNQITPGYFIPAGAENCNNFYSIIDKNTICNIESFDNIIITPDNTFILEALAEGNQGVVNVFYIKFIEQQNDLLPLTSYGDDFSFTLLGQGLD